ncbi:MAG: hypothetical protein GY710_09940 [Desulfobacteraceae bacterium]|nr:hypothetical protein [Desulfobacteraceae bacterium]
MAFLIPGYKILALGPFAPVPDEKFKANFVPVDLYSIDQAITQISPVLYLPLPTTLCPDGALTLKFDRIKDFKSDVIMKNNSFLKSVPAKSTPVPDKSHTTGVNKSFEKKSSEIDDILSIVAVSDSSSKEILGEEKSGTDSLDIMTRVFSNPVFKQTESAWRGLQTLVKQARIKGAEQISMSISSVSHNSLELVLSQIELLPYDKIPNLILVDLGFDNTPASIKLLGKIAEFADRIMVPVSICLKPDFFRIEDWDKLGKISYINNHLNDISYVKFRKIKKLPGADWIIANCNYFTLRPANEYEDHPLLASPVWALGTLCAKAVQKTGWPGGFTQYMKYKIDDLPMYSNDQRRTSSTQVLLSEERIMQFIEVGITPVVGAIKKDFVFIPKQTSLACGSIKFQLFFNRIIESLIHAKEKSSSNSIPENEIKSVLMEVFTQTGHASPKAIDVIKEPSGGNGQQVFMISFIPPESVIVVTGKIEFSFVW